MLSGEIVLPGQSGIRHRDWFVKSALIAKYFNFKVTFLERVVTLNRNLRKVVKTIVSFYDWT